MMGVVILSTNRQGGDGQQRALVRFEGCLDVTSHARSVFQSALTLMHIDGISKPLSRAAASAAAFSTSTVAPRAGASFSFFDASVSRSFFRLLPTVTTEPAVTSLREVAGLLVEPPVPTPTLSSSKVCPRTCPLGPSFSSSPPLSSPAEDCDPTAASAATLQLRWLLPLLDAAEELSVHVMLPATLAPSASELDSELLPPPRSASTRPLRTPTMLFVGLTTWSDVVAAPWVASIVAPSASRLARSSAAAAAAARVAAAAAARAASRFSAIKLVSSCSRSRA